MSRRYKEIQVKRMWKGIKLATLAFGRSATSAPLGNAGPTVATRPLRCWETHHQRVQDHWRAVKGSLPRLPARNVLHSPERAPARPQADSEPRTRASGVGGARAVTRPTGEVYVVIGGRPPRRGTHARHSLNTGSTLDQCALWLFSSD